MNKSINLTHTIIQIIIILSTYIIGAIFYSQLPDPMPTHWNIHGQIDGWMPRQIAVWLLPSINLVMFGLFIILPKIDPKKANYKLFQPSWQIISTSIITTMAYFYIVNLYVSIRTQDITPYVLSGIGILFMILGNFLSKIRQNYFIGVKTPWTLNDPDNWNHTHRLASWTFAISGLAILISALTNFATLPTMIIAIVCCTAIPLGYSYLYYKQHHTPQTQP